MAVDLTIRQGDTTPAFTTTVTDQSGDPLNLTGATVTFIMRALSAATPAVNAAMAITDAAAGAVQYSWSSSDTETPGLYMAELHVTLEGGGTYTYPNVGYLQIEVEESLLSPVQQLVTVAAVKDVLNLADLDRIHDTKILRWINAVRPVVERIVGPVIIREFEEWHDGGHYSIVLRRRPSVALGTDPYLLVMACSEYNGPIEWPLSIISSPDQGQQYSVEPEPNGRLVRRTAGGGVQAFPDTPQSVHVVYQAGQNTVPDNVSEAALELIRVNYQSTAQALRGSSGGGRGGGQPVDPPATGFFVPGRVRELLQPNRRFPSLA